MALDPGCMCWCQPGSRGCWQLLPSALAWQSSLPRHACSYSAARACLPAAGFSLGALEQLLAENQRLAAVEAQAVGQAAAAAQLRELQVGLAGW